MNILLVCTANICRSVMAEGILRKLAADSVAKQILTVASAGVDALQGKKPDRYTAEVCLEQGIDVGLRNAKQLTRDILEEADVILCMEQMHKQRILGVFPEFTNNVFLLKEYLHSGPLDEREVKDPIGRPKKEYERTFTEIEQELQRIALASDWFAR